MGDRVEGDQVQICGAMGDILNRIGDKWSVMVVGHLTKKTMRFNELRHSIGGISQRMLTLTLRNLERDGLVIRTVYPEIPPRVEYQLTELGRTLTDPLDELWNWAARHMHSVNEARAVVDELSSFVAAKPQTAAGRRALADLSGDIIDGGNLVRLAETEILGPLDAQAKGMILDAAKRVSLVTAISPRALVDIAYVVFEAGRLIRRLSELYGGRPGTLGFFRLARGVLAHLAVTGSIAFGDSVVQQIVGHGLAARLSAKLGEGVVNGMMTARIGLAAMETTSPLPFIAAKRPGMGDFLTALTSFAKAKGASETTVEN